METPLSRNSLSLARSTMGDKIWLSRHPRKFGNHVTVRPSTPQGNHWEMSFSNNCSSLQPAFNWQLPKQGIRWPVSHDYIAGFNVNLPGLRVFWNISLTRYERLIDRRRKSNSRDWRKTNSQGRPDRSPNNDRHNALTVASLLALAKSICLA